MIDDEITKNMEYVKTNFDTLLNLYRNKFVLVNEQNVVGSFDSYEAAAEEGVKTYGLDAGFLVHFISENSPINFIALAVL